MTDKVVSQPNILFIMCDQLSAFATSPYGNQNVLTPNLDELAKRGTVFERSYCNSPCCAPSRASMMTGKLASRIPVNDNAEELPASVPTFAHNLRYGGYATVLSGKMHFVGPDQLHGFEERLTTDIFPSDFLWAKYWPAQGKPPRWAGLPGNQQEVGKHYDVRDREWAQLVKESGLAPWNYQMEHDEETHFRSLQRLRSFSRNQDVSESRPWFLCVSYTQPHDPYVAIREYWDRYEKIDLAMPEEPPPNHEPHPADIWVKTYHGLDKVPLTSDDVYRARRAYFAMTSYIDDKVGELIAELKRLGQYDNTVIIFTSDHGDQLGEHGMWDKLIHREWSTRVPLIVAGPNVVQNHRVTQNVSLVDLYPTLVELASLEQPNVDITGKLDGHSLMTFLQGEKPSHWSNRVTIESNGEGTIKPICALVEGLLKFVYVHEHPDQLFDLSKDPNEWQNIVDESLYEDAAARLHNELLWDWDPAETERKILASQRRRMFIKDALYEGKYTPWDYQPIFNTSRVWVRRGSNRQWDPDLGF